ncbi:MAG TPA: type 1 glutamine amidotransferase [Solirubrobacteraceae bacterium]|jgi:GMP synthase-like glutamine amidotransferase|nr:type 1 glutamine amidotransferase [Solirubrobacteraceae bacterium]
MEILVLEHEREVPAALFGDWAAARGHTLRTVAVAELARFPDPRTLDVVVSLGSDRSIPASRESWIAAEIELLRRAHDCRVPVLGICFGAQALASALGGEVSHAAQLALDWTTLDTHDDALISPGPWLRWHEDILTVPPGARELARAGSVPLAFVHGSSVGVQFHPEVDAELAEAWIEDSRRTLSEHAFDLGTLRRQVALAAPGAPVRAHQLFDRIARLWGERT